MAKPVVSTDVGDVALYVRDGLNGYIVEVGDAHMLAERQKRLIDDRYMREGFGRTGRDIAKRELDINRCARRHLQAYMDILGKNEGGDC